MKRWIFALLSVAVGLVSAGAAEENPALLASASGTVSVVRDGQMIEVSFGSPLNDKDVIQTGSDGKAAILFRSGRMVELGPNSEVAIGDKVSTDTDGPILAEMPSGGGALFAQAATSEEGMSAMPTLRSSGGESFQAIHPRNTRAAQEHVTFRWTEAEEALEYRLTLTGPDGARKAFSTEDTEWTAKGVEFEPGQQWTWFVEAVTVEGEETTDPVTFEVASAEAEQELKDVLNRLESLLEDEDAVRRQAARYVLATYCGAHGFYGSAIEHLESLVHENPDASLYARLGSYYEAVGMSARAAEAYRHALN